MTITTPFSGPDYSFNLISENKGDKVERHYHEGWDETWFVVKGRYRFVICGVVKELTAGETITAKRNFLHSVECLEDGSQRIAIFKDGVKIYYVED